MVLLHNTTEVSDLAALPDSLLHRILGLLPLSSLLAARASCQVLKRIASCEVRQVLADEASNQAVAAFSSCSSVVVTHSSKYDFYAFLHALAALLSGVCHAVSEVSLPSSTHYNDPARCEVLAGVLAASLSAAAAARHVQALWSTGRTSPATGVKHLELWCITPGAADAILVAQHELNTLTLQLIPEVTVASTYSPRRPAASVTHLHLLVNPCQGNRPHLKMDLLRISQAEQLQKLSIKAQQILNVGELRHLQRLHSLRLEPSSSVPGWQDEALAAAQQLTQLKELTLENTSVSARQWDELVAALSELQHLQVSALVLGQAAAGKLTSLQALSLVPPAAAQPAAQVPQPAAAAAAAVAAAAVPPLQAAAAVAPLLPSAPPDDDSQAPAAATTPAAQHAAAAAAHPPGMLTTLLPSLQSLHLQACRNASLLQQQLARHQQLRQLRINDCRHSNLHIRVLQLQISELQQERRQLSDALAELEQQQAQQQQQQQGQGQHDTQVAAAQQCGDGQVQQTAEHCAGSSAGRTGHWQQDEGAMEHKTASAAHLQQVHQTEQAQEEQQQEQQQQQQQQQQQEQAPAGSQQGAADASLQRLYLDQLQGLAQQLLLDLQECSRRQEALQAHLQQLLEEPRRATRALATCPRLQLLALHTVDYLSYDGLLEDLAGCPAVQHLELSLSSIIQWKQPQAKLTSAGVATLLGSPMRSSLRKLLLGLLPHIRGMRETVSLELAAALAAGHWARLRSLRLAVRVDAEQQRMLKDLSPASPASEGLSYSKRLWAAMQQVLRDAVRQQQEHHGQGQQQGQQQEHHGQGQQQGQQQESQGQGRSQQGAEVDADEQQAPPAVQEACASAAEQDRQQSTTCAADAEGCGADGQEGHGSCAVQQQEGQGLQAAGSDTEAGPGLTLSWCDVNMTQGIVDLTIQLQ